MRHCDQCQAELVPRTYEGGRTEHPNVFNYRRYCNRKCRTDFALGSRLASEVVQFQQMARQRWDKDIQL